MFPVVASPHASLCLDRVFLDDTRITLTVHGTEANACCPICKVASHRVQSRYLRRLADLPCQDKPVLVRWRVRRFHCQTAACPRRIFSERLPAFAIDRARTTVRLRETHRCLALALGGEAGARLATQLVMPTSPDTLLRRAQESEPAGPEPRIIGVDDWAFRKGQVYGTIIVDLERARVLDILPGRDGSALTAWLKQHPSVQVISRDRWAAYAQAAQEGAPQAQQVADRWHLLKNLRETMERLFARLSTEVQQALEEFPLVPPPLEASVGATVEPPSSPPAIPEGASASAATLETEPVPSPSAQARSAKQEARLQTFQRVRTLREQNCSLRQIARMTGLSVKTVRKFCSSDHCPDWKRGRRGRSSLQPFAGTVNAWLQAGGQNMAELFRQLQDQGCRASHDALRRFVKRQSGDKRSSEVRNRQALPSPTARPTARQLSFTFIRRPEKRTIQQQGQLKRLQNRARLSEALVLGAELADMLRQRSSQPLAEWLQKAEQAGFAELRSLAIGLRQDEAAVTAALTETWSNGAVEGHVNRLKLIKRQMYGRAGLPLLKARVRSAA